MLLDEKYYHYFEKLLTLDVILMTKSHQFHFACFIISYTLKMIKSFKRY